MSRETLVINDSNILFDLLSVDLLEDFCKVPIEKYTTDFVINEIKRTEQLYAVEKCIKNKKIIEKQFSSDEVIKISQLQQTDYSQALSFTDCSVWFLAKQLNGILLTGDNALRRIATADSIEVHGILYVCKMLVENSILPAHKMVEKVERLMELNKRLPVEECKKLIENLKRI